MLVTILIIAGIVGIWSFGFFVGRNNPNLKAVNNLIAQGKAIVDKTGNIVKALKKAA